jgi:glycosyl transferase, family 25
MKPSDKWTISLCQFHHLEQHSNGEAAFKSKYEVDLLDLARELARRSPCLVSYAAGSHREAHAKEEKALTDLLAPFAQVRIINLVDRPDRRREMERQLTRLGAMGPKVAFFDAHRPVSAGDFPSVGARGCFESHLTVLREARSRHAESLLLLEDDFDFTRDGRARLESVLAELTKNDWSLFYGAHVLSAGDRRGLVRISPQQPVLTASFVGFNGRVIPELVGFLEAMLLRPAGSPDYGPMHVDGAYTVFRELNPAHATFVAFPALGMQRSSPSDITPRRKLLDRWVITRSVAGLLRRSHNWLRRLA